MLTWRQHIRCPWAPAQVPALLCMPWHKKRLLWQSLQLWPVAEWPCLTLSAALVLNNSLDVSAGTVVASASGNPYLLTSDRCFTDKSQVEALQFWLLVFNRQAPCTADAAAPPITQVMQARPPPQCGCSIMCCAGILCFLLRSTRVQIRQASPSIAASARLVRDAGSAVDACVTLCFDRELNYACIRYCLARDAC